MEKPFMFLDLETTGHEPTRRFGNTLLPWHEIIDIGGIVANSSDLEIIHIFEMKVTPEHPERGDLKAWEINNFPERFKKGEWDRAVKLEEALRLLIGIGQNIGPCTLIGQNFSFDWSFLSVGFSWCDIGENLIGTAFDYGRLDTRSMAVVMLLSQNQPYDPKEFSLRSGLLQKKLGILPEPKPHKALSGAHQSYLTFSKLRCLKNIF